MNATRRMLALIAALSAGVAPSAVAAAQEVRREQYLVQHHRQLQTENSETTNGDAGPTLNGKEAIDAMNSTDVSFADWDPATETWLSDAAAIEKSQEAQDPSPVDEGEGKKDTAMIALIVVATVLVLATAALMVLYVRRSRRRRNLASGHAGVVRA